MKKENSFMRKFNDRIQIMGKEGIIGIIQENHIQVKGRRMIHTPVKYKKSASMNDITQLSKIEHIEEKNEKDVKDKYFFRANPRIYPRYNEPRDSSFISKSANLYVRPADNLQNIVDHGYRPYTIKEFNNLPKEIKLGKLGPNFDAKWRAKKKRVNKMKEYANHILDVGHGLVFRNIPSPEEIRAEERKKKIQNGRIMKIREYVNKMEGKDGSELNIFRKEGDNAILRKNKQMYIDNQNKYLERLEKLKAKLIQV